METLAYQKANLMDANEEMVLYLDALFAINSPQLIIAALSERAQRQGMALVSEKTGLNGDQLRRFFASENPDLSTTLRVMQALGLFLNVSIVDRA